MAGKNDIFSASWCEIVFEKRNKTYGAYELRKRYEKNIFVAVIVAVSFFVVAMTTPLIIELIKSRIGNEDTVKIVEGPTTLAEPPPIDKNEPPPPPVEPPPPLKSTIKFTPPVIVKDELVTDTVRTQQDLSEKEVSTKTQEGDSVHGADLSLLDDGKGKEDPEANKIFLVVEQSSEFPGGDEARTKFIQNNLHYPAIAKENGIQGIVYITFVIDKEGKVTDASVRKGVGAGLDEEALRVIKLMPPWKPAKQAGKAVKQQFTLPIRFALK